MNGKRLAVGFGWGVAATIAQSIFMIIGVASGMSPFPKPVPIAIVEMVFGEAMPAPMLMFLAIAIHLGYGGFWGLVLADWTRPVTIWKGIALGIFLWLIMQVTVLPLLGWGFFGFGITPKIAVATFVLHLIYGMTFGWLMDRNFERGK